jgi:Cdc6-like AAA superfamily ATPase
MGILFKLIQHLDPNTQIKRSGYSIDYYYDALFLLMNKKNKSLMVILDGIDFLKS